jgi:hypothetical protein
VSPQVGVIVCLVLLLAFWCYRKAVVQHRAIQRYRASCVHNWERIYAYNDQRFPVDRCRICGEQRPVKRPVICPYCKANLGGTVDVQSED